MATSIFSETNLARRRRVGAYRRASRARSSVVIGAYCHTQPKELGVDLLIRLGPLAFVMRSPAFLSIRGNPRLAVAIRGKENALVLCAVYGGRMYPVIKYYKLRFGATILRFSLRPNADDGIRGNGTNQAVSEGQVTRPIYDWFRDDRTRT